MQYECVRCRGSGYANAARDSGMEDAPRMMKPFGVYPCSTCNGTGKVGMSEEAEALLRKIVEEALAKCPTPNTGSG
jgi:DnaJ-class molecular chaperone